MNKFMNDPEEFVEDSLKGIMLAYPMYLKSHPDDLKAVFRTEFENRNKVSVVTGGGYGHIPVFMGYVGPGLCDGVAVGNVFTTPSSNTIMNVTKSVPHSNGVVYLFGNYMGDRINFQMAGEIAGFEGIKTTSVIISDDVVSAPREEWRNRRGIAGITFAYKIAGAAALAMKPIEEVVRITEKANENMATYGASFTSCQLPSIEKPIFEIGENEMELGMGIHGEPGVKRIPLMKSAEIARIFVNTLVEDLSLKKGEEVAVLVNGLGASTREELFILYRDVHGFLCDLGIRPVRSFIGEYATSLGMNGASLSLLKLDAELLRFLDMPASSPFVKF